MIFFIIALFILCIYKITIYQKPNFNPNYLSIDTTISVKGLFVLLIIASHLKQYVTFSHYYDKDYLSLSSFMIQAIVVPFLFYSGYGIFESIKKKGNNYINQIPVKRIMLTWINLACANFIFIILNLLLKIQVAPKTTILAFTGWTDIGNCNWYIFAMLYLYIVTWISFKIFKKHPYTSIVMITLFSALYMFIIHDLRPKESWWYDTIFCYATGMWYSYFKETIEKFFNKKHNLYYCFLLLTILLVIILRPYINYLPLYEFWSVCFACMIVFMTMKFSIHNPILHWIGVHTFEIYMLQRIPMIILKHFHVNEHPYIFTISVFVTIFPIAFLFRKMLLWLDQKVLHIINV